MSKKEIFWRIIGGSFRERAFRVARCWSNVELARFASRLEGSVVNVSAWEDKDKEGRTYRDYFTRAQDYFITNYGTSQGVLQGTSNEYFLDLERPVPPELNRRFDVVFNHTTLEHVWEFRTAFANLCTLAREHVVVVVPWLQPVHADYGDYWRFSPVALARMFEENSLTPMHISWNESPTSSVYVFGIGTRSPAKLNALLPELKPIRTSPAMLQTPSNFAGRRAFSWRPWPVSKTRSLAQELETAHK